MTTSTHSLESTNVVLSPLVAAPEPLPPAPAWALTLARDILYGYHHTGGADKASHCARLIVAAVGKRVGEALS